MAYWIIDDEITTSASCAIYFTGNDKEFTAQLVVEEGDSFPEAYLVVANSSFASLVSATVGELGGEPGPSMPLMAYGDPTCFLGTLVGPQELELTFTFNLPAAKAGEFAIPILMGYGDGLPGATPSTWSGDDTETSLWADDECQAPLWTAVMGPRPLYEVEAGVSYPRQTYDRALPGESLSFGQVVYLDTTGGDRLLKLARNDETFAEAAAIGIIDDEAINYQFRDGGGVTSDGDASIYWHGGSVGGAVVQTMARLDWSTRLWYAMPTGGGARKHHTITYLNGKAYVWGGVDGAGNYLNTLYEYDEYSDMWTALASEGTARALHAALVIGDEIHFVGGVNADGVVSSVDIYSTTGGYWSTGIVAPVGLLALSVGLSPLALPYWQDCDGTLYYGGSTAARDRKFYTYDATGTWGEVTLALAPIEGGRGVLPTAPLAPTGSYPQYCTRIQPGGEGAAYWICMDTEDNGSGF